MRKTYPVFAMLFYAGMAVAQDNNPVELVKQLRQTTDPARKMELLDKLTEAAFSTDMEQARAYAMEALRVAEDNGAKSLRATANLMAGKAYAELTRYDSAGLFLDRAQADLETLNRPDQRAEVYYWKGFMAANSREFSTATESYFKAIELWEQLGDRKKLARVHIGLSDVYATQNIYDKGITYSEKAIELLEAIGDDKQLGAAVINLAYTYTMMQDYEKALVYATRAVSIYEQLGSSAEKELARALNSRGNAYKFLARYDEAIQDYEKCRSISEKIGFVRGVVASTANTGHTLLLKKKYAEALPYTLRAIEMMTVAGDLRNLEENLMNASNSYVGLGDYKNAHLYLERQLREVERQHEERVAQLEQGLTEKYEAGQRAATIVLQAQRIEQQNTIQMLLAGSAVILTVLLLLIYRGLRAKQKINRLLGSTNALLEKKNRDNELLLKEIHHRVKNNLEVVSSLLALQGAHIHDPEVLNAITESQNRVHSMGMIHQRLYQGENLAAIEMKDYFVHLGEGILDSFGAESRIQVECAMEELELDVDTAVPIGLIVNELLTNALKYAFPGERSGEIKISLRESADDTLHLEIADNGVGKTTGETAKGTGFGTQLVQLLTRQLAGQISERTDHGTIVSLTLRKSKAA
ncbi:MAG: histidine kinase dimerization/phosphoacceptor domain -containing protein [Saprospiraceae bacterium]|nr:histidine kinase dimerization/phosphoacceptor domain -containing protein [Saprospiraceae bacterium]